MLDTAESAVRLPLVPTNRLTPAIGAEVLLPNPALGVITGTLRAVPGQQQFWTPATTGYAPGEIAGIPSYSVACSFSQQSAKNL